ncbi:MAG: HEAT repeat domain-containing protein [Gemmataceae bacterium]
MTLSTRVIPCLLLGLLGGLCLVGQPAHAYITFPVQTLGAALTDSDHVTLVKLDKFDREKGILVFTKVRDLKGKYPLNRMRHVFKLKDTPQHKGLGAVPVKPDETDWSYALKSAKEGNTAIVFSKRYEPYGDFGHVYINGLWYATMCPERDWDLWYAIYSDPRLLSQWHAGTPEQLATAIDIMMTGRKAYVPVLGKGTKADLRAGKATLYTLGAWYGIREFNAARDVLPEPLEPGSIPKLVKTLSSATEREKRAQAAGALGLLGPNAKIAVKALSERVTSDSSGTVRVAAADALARLGPNAKSALPALEAALKDPSMSHRKDVQTALKSAISQLKESK